MASRLFQAYNSALTRRPLLTQSITAASLYAVGDVIAQGVSASTHIDKSKWDWERTLRMTAIGGFALGPTMAICVLARVLADQAIFAPGSIVGLYYLTELLQPSIGTIQDRLSAAQQSVESSFNQVLLKNYTLWPAVSYLNFFYIPLQYRLLVSNTVAIFWSAYLSFTVNRVEPGEEGSKRP
uniref:Uncharacterized protein n=1 Tax=Bionectria ochroleuca TaxID=29856 RepID=A0A8H7KDC8_BIOOC